MKLSLSEVKQDEDLRIYFNWTSNALLPIFHGGADQYLKIHRQTIKNVARDYLTILEYTPDTLYRGIILRQPVTCLMPDNNMQYVSFSEDKGIAEHFADVDGFGSDIVDVRKQLGTFGYVIEYKPAREEVLFHHDLLDILPYREAFTHIGIDGEKEVCGLKKQKEIMILQPASPFTNIKLYQPELINK